ncbi:MAG: arginase family protein [Chloroflexota bacterium]
MAPRVIRIVGAPFNSSGTTDGVARAPTALRRAGLVERLRAAGLEVTDRGDLNFGATSREREPISGVIAPGALATMIRAVGAEVEAALQTGGFPLVLGGDCPVLLGCLNGGDRRQVPGLFFIDGHEDAWPPAASTTGEAADMELGFALGLTLSSLPQDLRAALPRLDPDDVVVVGPRDQGELAAAGVPTIGDLVEIVRAEEASADPIAVAASSVDRLGRMGAWWLHVDLDVLSTESLGAIDYPQAGGIGWEALTSLTRRALKSRVAIGWDVTIYNPDLDPRGTDAARIVRYIVESLAPGMSRIAR